MTVDHEQLSQLLKVYFIMGSPNCLQKPEEVLKEAIAGGITLFQFREKGTGALKGTEKAELGKKLLAICRENQIPFIVNDDIDLALQLDADGVHIGQEDEPVEIVRKKIGNKILGVSAHSIEEAQAAIESGADYLGLGPIYPTKTKQDTRAVQGLSLIKDLRENGITIPFIGIGGINASNARQVVKAGADGVSVITAISHAASVSEAVNELKKQVLL
ncbi:thiamine phosphate synthase [Bacillus sp. IB182487]|uniref:Thiamine-phosphate synthase n=1 Tax=Metabacillus arenae TaxID=2771434 RepID=A0A926RYV8_9BACI|nr:thiamine phosphate synthase [Metabacillus arenae]MBD1382175.1 thiamine phosphate synthase [Metabacillus arenae]